MMELVIGLILGLNTFNALMIVRVYLAIIRMQRRPRPRGREDYEQ